MVKLALAEDVGTGDITTKAIITPGQKAKAIIRAKEKGVIAGMGIAKEVFRHVDHRMNFTPKVRDGKAVKGARLLPLSLGRRGGS